MRGYKAFETDLTCRGFRYEIGKTYEHTGEIEVCKAGFHFCATIADCYDYYPKKKTTRICEVEASGTVKAEGNKYVTNKITVIAEVTDENVKRGNAGKDNVGYMNSGGWNSGNRNSGNMNSGDMNSGDWNSGDWNATNHSAGCFCTKEQKIMMFDQPSEWTYDDWVRSEARNIMFTAPRGCYRVEDVSETTADHLRKYTADDMRKWWNELPKGTKAVIRALPNYDEEKFLVCIGIKKNEGEEDEPTAED